MTEIEVLILDTGDNATCPTPEAALIAARTMGGEAKTARGMQGFDPRITFTVDGAIVRSTTLRSLNREVH